MSEKSMFFNSTEDDIREYSAGDFADCLSAICPNNGRLEGLKLSYNNNGIITVGKGKAIINGYIFCMDEEKNFVIPILSYQRIDNIVLQLSMEDRKIHIIYKTGESVGNSPVLTQNSSIYEISLGEITVPANCSGMCAGIKGNEVYANKSIFYGTAEIHRLYDGGKDSDIYIQY